jgi:uncharacterized membrane protein
MDTSIDKNEIRRLIEVVENLNARISALESSVPQRGNSRTESIPHREVLKESSEDLEFRIGEQWFGKIGVVAFLFAVFYLLTLPFDKGAQTFVILLGYIISAVMISTAFYKQEQLKSLGGYIAGSGMIILYFSTLKLHYFTGSPFISEPALMIPLLYAVSIGALLLSLKKSSSQLVMISLILFGTTALLSDIPALIAVSLVVLTLSSVYISSRYNWNNVLLFSIPLVYLIYFLWYINNPISGREISLVNDTQFSFLLLPLIITIFGLSRLKGNEETDDYFSIVKSLLNAVPGCLLFVYAALNLESTYAALLNTGMSFLFIYLASVYWVKQNSKISTFIYSMTGYGALSFAIILSFKSPESYILLCWQSILVVSTALWFRSRFIVVANFFIFTVLLVTYLITGSELQYQSLSFGLVALISARLINVHQLRLELQSEQLRNAYLIIAVLVIPFILYSILPSSVVGISWIILAFMYYVVGKLINNKKYRLMASATLIMSLAYIFLFGLTSSDTVYKILSFTLVSIALVIISLTYSKVKTKEKLGS